MEEHQQVCWWKINCSPLEIVRTNGWVSGPGRVVYEVANKLVSCDKQVKPCERNFYC